jgi:hypothetical protein
LVKSVDDQQAEAEAAQQQAMEMQMMQSAPGLLKAPIADPSKNPNAEALIAEALSPE